MAERGSIEALALSDHLRNHLTDGHWHDDCRWCLVRREIGGTGEVTS